MALINANKGEMKRMKAARDSNIELLRIVSMLMTLTLHYLLFGNALTMSAFGSAAYYGNWTLEAVCLTSVDCYMLISGFFLSQKNFTSRRVLSFYAQILFYTIVLALLCFSLGIEDLNTANLIQIVPVMGGKNWYVTAYFCLLFLTPILNHVVHSMERRRLKAVLTALFILLSVLHTLFFFTDTFRLENGHSVWWYCFVYMIGAYYRKYEIRLSRKTHALGLMILLLPLSKFVVDSSEHTVLRSLTQVLYAYDSFPVLVASLVMFDCFVQIRIRSERANKIICLFGKTSFAVFYIHAFVLWGEKIWTALGSEKYIGSNLQLIHLIASVAAVYIACSAVEIIRMYLFQALKIDEAISAVSKKIDAKVIPAPEKKYAPGS